MFGMHDKVLETCKRHEELEAYPIPPPLSNALAAAALTALCTGQDMP